MPAGDESTMWIAEGEIDAALIVNSTNSLFDGVLVTDAQERIVAVNDAICTITGYSRTELIGSTCGIMQGPNTQPELIAMMRQAVEKDELFVGEVLNYRKDGRPYWNGLSIAPVRHGGVVTHYVSMQRDITNFVARRNAIENEHETTAMMLNVARALSGPTTGRDVAQIIADAVPGVWGSDRSAVMFWDDEGEGFVVAALSGWDREITDAVTGWRSSREESPGFAGVMDSGRPTLLDRSTSEWAAGLIENLGVEAIAATPIEVSGRFLGIVGAAWAQTPPPGELDDTLIDRMTGIAGLAGVALDQTRLHDAIEWTSMHDAATGLPNRRHLDDHIAEALDDLADTGGDDVIVIACDIDRFRRISDAYPTMVVDGVLHEIAARLSSAVGDRGFVARIGGDDFVAVLRGHVDDTEAVMARLHDAFALPFIAGDDTVYASLSLGVAASADVALPDESSEGRVTPAQRLVSLAEADLSSRRGVRGHDAGIEGPEEGRLDTDLRSAVANGEIEVYYQPQVGLPGGAIVGVEALVRWNHPILGQISPVRFIPLAEYNGVIRDIGRFVLETACADAARWAEAGHSIEVAVNVAVHQLEDPTFADMVARTLRTTGVGAERVTLEVTESRVVPDRSIAQAQLRRLAEMGLTVSVDDFGTGFSSLTQLNNMPVGELKIDRSFTADVTKSGRQMVAGVIGLARGLDLRVVAEGVEDEQQLEVLRNLGCDRAQGFHLARPMPAIQLERDWMSAS